MIEPQSLINIVHSGLNKLTDSDKQCIKYEIKESDSTISLYIYKTIPSTNQLNILRLSDHLPSMQKLIRGNTAPRPSVIENSNVSIDFYKPKRIIQVDTAGNAKVKKVPNRFDNYVGVPSNIPQVEPFTVSSFQYFYKDLDQSDEMILWHSIATWVCCLDPNKEYHDPFASDETKMAKTETKTAEVHVFGDKIEITENKQYNNMNKKLIRLTEGDLHKIIKESVSKILTELDWKTYMNAARARQAQGNGDKASNLETYANNQFNQQHFGNKGYYGSNVNGNSAMLQGGVNTKGGEMHDTRDYGANFDGTMSTTKASGKQIHGYGKELVGNNRGYANKMQQRYSYDQNNLNGLQNVTDDYKLKMNNVGNDLDGYYNNKSKYVKGQGWQ